MALLGRSLRPALAALLLAACTSTYHGEDRLFRELGGLEGIDAITNAFLYELAENEAALPLFLNTDIERFRDQFKTQLCDVSGGPCDYTGDTMRDTHRGMNISRAQFNSVVEDLIAAMERTDTPLSAQNALLERLAALYPEIVDR
jgi:hemoglobin